MNPALSEGRRQGGRWNRALRLRSPFAGLRTRYACPEPCRRAQDERGKNWNGGALRLRSPFDRLRTRYACPEPCRRAQGERGKTGAPDERGKKDARIIMRMN